MSNFSANRQQTGIGVVYRVPSLVVCVCVACAVCTYGSISACGVSGVSHLSPCLTTALQAWLTLLALTHCIDCPPLSHHVGDEMARADSYLAVSFYLCSAVNNLFYSFFPSYGQFPFLYFLSFFIRCLPL